MNLKTPIIEVNKVVFPFVFVVPLFLLIFKHISSKHHKLPPGPYPWPIIGNIFHIGKKPHISLTSLAQIHGQLMSLRVGAQLLVVGSSQAAATEILRTHDRVLSGRFLPAMLSKVPQTIHSSLAMSKECSSTWRFLRTICQTELFSGKAVASQAKWRERKVMDMVEYLGTKEGEIVKLGEIVFVTVTNSLSNILVSRDLINFEGKSGGGMVKGHIRRLIELVATPSLSDLYPVLGELDIWSKHNAMDIYATNKIVWGDIIKARRESQYGDVWSTTGDFLDVLIENAFSDDMIYILLMELLTAGTDSSCSTVEWILAELIKNQEVMQKLRIEVAKTIDGDVLRESHLPHLPYLQACVKETLRLHPPGPFLMPHRALQTCQVMNYTIPKDSIVLVNIRAIGRDPVTWDDPLSFKPERFLESNLDFKGTHFEFIPFSAGRRICAGLPMAVTQVQLIVASLVHYFDWFLPPGMDSADLDMNEKFGMTVQMEKPLWLRPSVRKDVCVCHVSRKPPDL